MICAIVSRILQKNLFSDDCQKNGKIHFKTVLSKISKIGQFSDSNHKFCSHFKPQNFYGEATSWESYDKVGCQKSDKVP